MTSERKPAGAPEDRGREAAVGAPENEAGSRQQAEAPEPSNEQPATSNENDAAAADVSHDLDALLGDVKRERDEYLKLAQRAKADFENYRKRAVREAADAERRGRAGLARALVPSLDNLERALAAADDGSELARGVELVHGELQATLARAGVESYDPTGERFDPAWHEAISTRPSADGEPSGTVVETLERGYRIDGQVLRPARVVVSE